MDTHQKETYQKWRKLVNMSASELKKFYNSEEGKEAGLKPSEAKAEGIDYGRESARWILKMKKTPVKDWTPSMWKWAEKQIWFISRMSGNKGGLYDEDGNKTRKHLSLLIWGNNPEKYEAGGDLPSSKKSNTFTKYGIQEIISGESENRNANLIKAIISYLRTGKGSISKNEDIRAEIEKTELTKYVSDKSLWFIGKLDQETFIDNGTEQRVYLDASGDFVYKTNSGIYYDFCWSKYFINILLHNYYFPDTAYELIGFIKSPTGMAMPVVKQRFIKSDSETNQKEVESFLTGNGFDRINPIMNAYINKKDGVILSDLHSGNIVTQKGELFFIDTKFFLNDYEIFRQGGSVTNNKEIKMDKLSGGKSDKKDIYQIAREQNVGMDFAIEQWNKGTEVEMEHTNDKSIAKEISLDHLSESIFYYIELEKMEQKLNEQIILYPRSAQELRRSLELAKEQELPKEKVYDIQKSYFSEYVSEDPNLLSEFLESIKHLTKDRRFDFGSEITWSQERVGGQDYIRRFLENVEKRNLNLFDLLPESFRKHVKVKRVDFTPSPESEGLVKITDLFVAYDELRPQLMGTYFDKENDLIACTNTHILLLISAIPDVEKSSICLMGKALNYYKTKVLANPNDIDQNNDGCWEYSANKYPDYMRVISREYPNVIDINVDNLSTYLKTAGEYLANYITRQVYIGYTEVGGDKVFIGVNAFLLLDCLKGLQMLGHRELDLCHDGQPNRAITIIPSGNSRKIGKKSIKTDLALCMPVMARQPEDYEVMYDLDENIVKTVGQFYGREAKQEEIVPEPIVEPTPIEVSDPIEPVVEAITPNIAEMNVEQLEERLSYLLDGLKSLGIADQKGTIHKDYLDQMFYTDKEGYQKGLDRLNEYEQILEKVQKLNQEKYSQRLSQIRSEESNEVTEIKETIEGLKILLGLTKTKKEKKEIQEEIDGLNIILEMPETFELGGPVNIDETTFRNSPAYIETVDSLTQMGLYDSSLSDSDVYSYYMELGNPKFKDAPEYFEEGGVAKTQLVQ